MRFPLRFAACVSSVVFGAVGFADDPPDFNAQVLPIFKAYCHGCHNANDAEGGLNLQDHASTMKGGEDGAVIDRGHGDRSPLWKRLTADDESRMPPKKRPAPKADEIALIRRWIDAGAKASAPDSAPTRLVTPKIPVRKSGRAAVVSIATAPDNGWFAVARPHAIQLFRDARGQSQPDRQLEGHLGTISDVSFSRDGQWLCVAAGEPGLLGEVTLWRTADWSRDIVIQGHRDALYGARISDDGTKIATASYDREVIIWDVKTRQALKTCQGHNDAIYGVAFSPSGKLIATASGDRTVKLWDVATGQRLDTFSQPAKEQSTVVFSPDGRLVAAAGVDCRIRVWQISDSAQEGSNPIQFARFAHEGPILKLAFSPNGKLLASSSEDRRIKLWETTTFTQVAVLDRQSDWAPAVTFSSDNRQLLVGRMNGEYQAYSIQPNWFDGANPLQRLDESGLTSDEIVNEVATSVREVEPNNVPAQAMPLKIPTTVTAELKAVVGSAEDLDLYRFEARRGDRLVIETNAGRSGSLADTKLEILHADGRPVVRALLQAVRDSWINFRPIDSSSPDLRLEFWEEMDLNQYLYLNGEVCKLFRAPQGPDSGYQLYAIGGKRRNYLDTSAAAHAKDEPAYIVEAYAANSKIVDNGLPVFPVLFSNDDDADRQLGKDSRLTFTAPEDGTYLVHVSDVRGFSGDKFSYSLTVRRPRPDFAVTVNTMNPKVPAGSGQRLKFTVGRLDGFEGEVRIDLVGLPKGFEASSPVVVQSGLFEATSVLTAKADAEQPAQDAWERAIVLATAEVQGLLMTKTIGSLGEIKLEKAGPIKVSLLPDDPRWTSADHGLVIEPGTTITAKIVIERNGHEDDVRFDVDNLPHGIIVDNIGLSGVLVRKQETERQIFLTARPWVPETDRLIHAVSQNVGNQASPAIRLHVRRGQRLAAN